MGVRMWLAKKLFANYYNEDAATSSGKRDPSQTAVKGVGLRFGDVTSKEFTEPDFDLSQITTAYNTDAYVRQGIDKYIDQMFKEGYSFNGKNQASVDYIKLRLAYIAEGTNVPTGQFLIDIAEDVVKYSNCMIVKVRSSNPNQLPPGATIQGIGGSQPVAGYFCLNPTTFKVQRDKTGMVTGWRQEMSGGGKTNFKPADVVHIYYKREKGYAFGTPFLIPVLDDVRALRQAEENVLRMLYRNIYPFYHVQVGEKDAPGTDPEVLEVQGKMEDMSVEGGIATTNRVNIKPIAADKVIDAAPYLSYWENRVFSGMGIPAIMFGRGNTANRSTGDNMTSEMSDRIKAMQKTIEMFFNGFIIKELLMEGGFDPVLNPDDNVEFRFNENDLDTKIKAENHFIFQYEHNAIDETEMRTLLGRDPVTDRALMYLNCVQIPLAEAQAQAKASAQMQVNSAKGVGSGSGSGSGGSSAKPKSSSSAGTKATNNKNNPTNQHGTKTSPKKVTNSAYEDLITDEYKRFREDMVELVDNFCNNRDNLTYSNIIVRVNNLYKSVLDYTDEIFTDEEGSIPKIYYTRLFKQLKDDVEDYVNSIADDNLKDLMVSLVDVFETRLFTVVNNDTLYIGKEEE